MIRTPVQLQAFKTYVENTAGAEESVYAKLTDNIELVGWSGTIGYTNAKPYKGVFDGGGYKISLIHEKVADSTMILYGLFWKISPEGAVKNLDLEVRIWPNLDENSTAMTGLVSPVAWRNEGTIEKVNVYCEILGNKPGSSVTGVVCDNFGRIENVTVTGWIEGAASSAAGIAYNSYAGSTISHCVNNAAITTGGGIAAGLVANLNGKLEYSANHGDVTNAGGGTYTGGLVGQINNSSLKITVEGKSVEASEAEISNCYNAGTVTGGISVLKIKTGGTILAPTYDETTQLKSIGGLVGGYSAAKYAFQTGKGINNSFNYGSLVIDGDRSVNENLKTAAIIGSEYATSTILLPAHLAGIANVYYLKDCAPHTIVNIPKDGVHFGVCIIFLFIFIFCN